jgi:hypothetical protein
MLLLFLTPSSHRSQATGFSKKRMRRRKLKRICFNLYIKIIFFQINSFTTKLRMLIMDYIVKLEKRSPITKSSIFYFNSPRAGKISAFIRSKQVSSSRALARDKNDPKTQFLLPRNNIKRLASGVEKSKIWKI